MKGQARSAASTGMASTTRGVQFPNRAAAAIDEVVDALAGYRHRGATERHIQDSVERVLAHRGWAYHREHALSAHDRPDFFLVDSGVVIEVKMKASRSFVLMQLGRYAVHDEVSALVLASPRCTVVAGLPAALYRKPLTGVQLPGVGLL